MCHNSREDALMIEAEKEQGEFVRTVGVAVKEKWKCDGDVEEKWSVMKKAMCDAARTVLGLAKKSHPDWYVESQSELKPLFQGKNSLHER
jgi:hypothetical protein